jgi:hypothetical protein
MADHRKVARQAPVAIDPRFNADPPVRRLELARFLRTAGLSCPPYDDLAVRGACPPSMCSLLQMLGRWFAVGPDFSLEGALGRRSRFAREDLLLGTAASGAKLPFKRRVIETKHRRLQDRESQKSHGFDLSPGHGSGPGIDTSRAYRWS